MWDNTIINLDEAMDRVMGHKEMYTRWLDKFFLPETLTDLQNAFSEKNHTTLHSATHKIKGTAANLAILSVAGQAAVLDEMAKAKADFASMENDYRLLSEKFEEAGKMYRENISSIENY